MAKYVPKWQKKAKKLQKDAGFAKHSNLTKTLVQNKLCKSGDSVTIA